MTSFFIPDIPIYICSDDFEGYLVYISENPKESVYFNIKDNSFLKITNTDINEDKKEE